MDLQCMPQSLLCIIPLLQISPPLPLLARDAPLLPAGKIHFACELLWILESRLLELVLAISSAVIRMRQICKYIYNTQVPPLSPAGKV